MASPWLSRIVAAAEQRLGVAVVEREQLSGLRENAERFRQFRDEAEELAYHSLSYFEGRPHELRHESRNRLAQRSRIALMEDPLAGAEADLLANFAFGRGITLPDATDEDVQKVIEEAWTDPSNEEKLTGFEAQRHRSNELLSQANLYPTAYVKNGRVRIGFLDADTVRFIVPDPEDEERPLWYASAKRRAEWDFDLDRMKTIDEMTAAGAPKVTYYPHWRNVEDILEQDGTVKTPPSDKLGDGKVFHVRINRIGRTEFGTPPWARTLRYFKAMDDLTQSHVIMAQAASTFVAKQSMTGTQNQLTKAANAVLTQTGELGAARFGETTPGEAYPRHPAPPPGSFWLENESNKLESLQLSSGAAQAAQTAQIVRAPIAASSSFGQHYLGDAGNANLATATSLELPTLMAVQAWQETMKILLTWFTDLVIQEAARAGRLGGVGGTLSEEEAAEEGIPLSLAQKPLDKLSLRESADKAELERRTGKDLSYTLSMPYPGRRNLPDVVSLVGTIVTAFDPGGVNVPLRRAMLTFLATHGMQLDDPQRWVDEVLPEDSTVQEPQAAQIMPGIDPATGQPYVDPRSADYVPPQVDPETGQPIGGPSSASSASSASGSSQGSGTSGGGGDKANRRERPPRARTGRSAPSDEMANALDLTADIGSLFAGEIEPLLLELTGGGGNGNGSGH